MTGLSLPAAIRALTVSTSSGLNGFHHSIRPIERRLANEIRGPRKIACRIRPSQPPRVTYTPFGRNARDLRSARLRNLDGEGPHVARRAVDQHLVARLDRPA